ncbi:MAG: hypothetical protein R2760_11545 [Chitinophagales bacterium]
MNWIKLGQVFKMKELHPLLKSHAANPLAVHLNNDTYRVFFSSRDNNSKSSVGFADIDIIKLKVLNICAAPIVKYGEEESFCSHGISIGNLYEQDDKRFILFMGWNIRNNEHWRGDIGRLELLSDNKTLNLNPTKAFIGIDIEDPISLSYPFVLFHEGVYKMWYGSTISWTSENGEMIHAIKYAVSSDGINWKRKGIAIPYEIGQAQAFSRPMVLIDKNGYKMWYSYRSGDRTKYRIGYATSVDGIVWERKHDEVGIDVSDSGWDSEMICYPFVFKHKKQVYMFYNGNDYGREGFGMARLKQ